MTIMFSSKKFLFIQGNTAITVSSADTIHSVSQFKSLSKPGKHCRIGQEESAKPYGRFPILYEDGERAT